MTMSNDLILLNVYSTNATQACNYILFHLETWHVWLAKALKESYIQYRVQLCYSIKNWPPSSSFTTLSHQNLHSYKARLISFDLHWFTPHKNLVPPANNCQHRLVETSLNIMTGLHVPGSNNTVSREQYWDALKTPCVTTGNSVIVNSHIYLILNRGTRFERTISASESPITMVAPLKTYECYKGHLQVETRNAVYKISGRKMVFTAIGVHILAL